MHKGLKAVLFRLRRYRRYRGTVHGVLGRRGAALFCPKKDFATRIKGQSLTDVFDRYFPDSAVQESIRHNLDEAQKTMRYDYIPGAPAFVQALRDSGIKRPSSQVPTTPR